MNIPSSMELSISKKNLDCDEIINFMVKNKIASSVFSNKSVVQYNDKWVKENGCRIIFNSITAQQLKQDIWYPLSHEFQLECAHLRVPSKFSDCINNFFRHKPCK